MFKIFCRIYQGIMKIGMYFLPWSMPETLEGPGKVKLLPKWIKDKGFHKVLIVTDQNLVSLHLLDGLIEKLNEENVEYILFDEVSSNPTDIDIERGVSLYKNHCCEAMIAFGGGSPMDCAKAIGARISRPHKKVSQLQGLLKVLRKIPVIFTVPTTAGTGSETTIAAVVTDSKTHHKASINDIFLIPKYTVLDPELTIGLPPHVTATTGMDALCHAIEAYTNNTYNTKLEKDLSKKAVKLIYDNLYTVYQDGTNIQARQNMQRAAFYAGRAFTRGCVGYVHAIGHTLGGLYGTPHGLAMGILLPHVMKLYGEKVYDKLADLCDICELESKDSSNKAKANAFIAWIEEMKIKMDIPLYPPIIKDEDVDLIVNWAIKEANPLYPTPVILNKTELKEFIQSLR